MFKTTSDTIGRRSASWQRRRCVSVPIERDKKIRDRDSKTIEFLPLHTEEDRKKTLEGTLFKKMIGFEPILKTVDYIANTPFITGSTLRVDAGRYYS